LAQIKLGQSEVGRVISPAGRPDGRPNPKKPTGRKINDQLPQANRSRFHRRHLVHRRTSCVRAGIGSWPWWLPCPTHSRYVRADRWRWFPPPDRTNRAAGYAVRLHNWPCSQLHPASRKHLLHKDRWPSSCPGLQLGQRRSQHYGGDFSRIDRAGH